MASKKLENVLEKLIEEISLLAKAPENFLSIQNNVTKKTKGSTKKLYDFSKKEETEDVASSSAALPELIIEHFDDEQIWQQLQLQNESLVGDMTADVAKAMAASQNISFDVKVTDDEDRHEDDGQEDSDEVYDEDEEGEDEDGGEESEEEDDEEAGLDGSVHSDSEEELDRILKEDEKQRFLEDGENVDSDSEIDFNFHLENEEKDRGKSQLKQRDKTSSSNRNKRKTVVDDKFFKLADMEQFLEEEDAKEERLQRNDPEDEEEDEDSEDVDMFKDFSSDDENEKADIEDVRYGDFFDPPDEEAEESAGKKQTKKKVSFEEDEEEEMDSEDEDMPSDVHKQDLLSDSEGEDVADILGSKKDNKSTFEKRQERLKMRVEEIEEAALSEKPWQLAGEVAASARPENSLLEEHLNFDHMTRLAPVITEETTKSLEDLIKQRIKDKAYDDVERKIKPKDDPFEYKKRITLDQEKSKLSLGEVYEQEYLKQTQKEEEEIANAEHEDIKKMMTSLFVKLDALSNFHYTPKPAAPEVQIVSNLPSINMEEVAPVSTSEATMLAPEEVLEKNKGELKGSSEKSETDRKRERREKKIHKKIKQKEKEKKQQLLEKHNPALSKMSGKKQAMVKLEKQSKSSKAITVIKDKENKKKSDIKSSAAFFTKLQEEVTTHISSKKASKKKQQDSKARSAAKLKL